MYLLSYDILYILYIHITYTRLYDIWIIFGYDMHIFVGSMLGESSKPFGEAGAWASATAGSAEASTGVLDGNFGDGNGWGTVRYWIDD